MKINSYTFKYPLRKNCSEKNVSQTIALNTFQFKSNKDDLLFLGNIDNSTRHLSFKGNIFNPIKKISDYVKYRNAQKFADDLYEYVKNNEGEDQFFLRHYNMDKLDGIQYNLKVFDGLSMKEIQYLSEFLHVIAVKRGCNHMCGHCYADARPSKREMSYEDFHDICDGFKTLRNRLHGLDIYGENLPLSKQDPIYRTTELFYDADCLNIILKDKKGKEYDFCDLAKELNESLGRVTVFDTAGWDLHNKKLQSRAEKYAKHFSNPENMKQLEAFNVSFNIFNASYIASLKALKNGDKEKAQRLREKFVKNMANTLFTFTPLLNQDKYIILLRAFSNSEKTAKGFTSKDLEYIVQDVFLELSKLYQLDMVGERKFIKNKFDIEHCLMLYQQRLSAVDINLNSAGRMLDFMKEHNISTKNMQNVELIGEAMKKSLATKPRFSQSLYQLKFS